MSPRPLPAMANSELLLALAVGQARRLGMQPDDAQDCAMEFVLRLVRYYPQLQNVPQALAQKAAYHQAVTYKANLARRQRRECGYTEEITSPPLEVLQIGHPASISDPCLLVLRKTLWAEVDRAIAQLTVLQRELFVGFHLRYQSVAEIAARVGRTPHAVYEGLLSARRRLAVLLQRAGWTASEVRQLFQTSFRAVPRTRFESDV